MDAVLTSGSVGADAARLMPFMMRTARPSATLPSLTDAFISLSVGMECAMTSSSLETPDCGKSNDNDLTAHTGGVLG